MLYDAILPVYLSDLGAGARQIGTIFSGVLLIASLANLVGGWLADRMDRRTIMLIFWIIGTPSAIFFSLANRWQWIVPGLALYYLSFIAFPSINAYITSSSDPKQLSSSFALLYATFPAAQLIGPGLGGFIADRWGMQFVFLVSFAFYLLSTLVIITIQKQPPSIELSHPTNEISHRKIKARMPGFWNYAILAAITYAFFSILTRFTSPYLVETRQLDLFSVGLLNSCVAIGAAILTALTGQLGNSINRMQLLAGTVLIFSVSLFMIAFISSIHLILLAFLLQGSFIAARSLMDSLVARSSRGYKIGQTFGIFGLLTGLGQAAAPGLGGWAYERSPTGAFYVIAACGIGLAFILFAFRALDEA